MKDALLIYNPIAGTLAKAEDDLIPRLIEQLRAGGIAAVPTETTLERTAQMIAADAAREGTELFIVAGGDGTVSDAAKALVGTKTALGIIPLGTYNNVGRGLGISFTPETACDQIIHGTVGAIDVGRVNGKHFFFEAAGIGLDAALFPLAEDIKQGSWLRYIEAAEIFTKFAPFRVTITLDRPRPGHTWRFNSTRFHVRTWMILCANAPFYGPGCEVSPSTALDDGLLSVHLFRRMSRLGLIVNLFRRMGGAGSVPRVSDKFTVRRIHVESSKPHPIHVDGVTINEWPLTIESLAGVLKVVRSPAQETNEESRKCPVGEESPTLANSLVP